MYDFPAYRNHISLLKENLKKEKKSQVNQKKVSLRLIITISSLIALNFILYEVDFVKFQLYNNGWIFTIALIVLYFSMLSFSQDLTYLKSKEFPLNKAIADLSALNALLENNKDYVFYLRDFSGAAKDKRGEYDTVNGKKSTTLCLDYFSTKYPIVLFNCNFDKTDFGNGIIIYSETEHGSTHFGRFFTPQNMM